jgi:hypothetical protein
MNEWRDLYLNVVLHAACVGVNAMNAKAFCESAGEEKESMRIRFSVLRLSKAFHVDQNIRVNGFMGIIIANGEHLVKCLELEGACSGLDHLLL